MKLAESKKLASDYGEEQAALYLKKHGYRIVGRNYKVRTGEIDLIVSDREYIVFVEVKMRKTTILARQRSSWAPGNRSASARRPCTGFL